MAVRRFAPLLFLAAWAFALGGPTGCKKKDKTPEACDPLAPDCPDGQVCQPLAEGGGECVDIRTCDPNAPDCPAGQQCARQTNGDYYCVVPLACDPAAPECAQGSHCLRQEGGEFLCVVPEPCDIAAPDCATGELCLTDGAGNAWCHPTCDPESETDCAADTVCDLLDTGEYACLEPVVITGLVFDLADASAIAGAHVAAADGYGAVVTDVVLSDAVGDYLLRVPVTRDAAGELLAGIFTLRAAAADYLPYPHGIRPAIPVDVTGAIYQEGRYEYSNVSTDIGLIHLPPPDRGQGSIAGTVGGESPGGALVVAECTAPPCPTGFADRSGTYTIFNVPAGVYTVRGFKAFLNVESVDLTLTAGEDATPIDLVASSDASGLGSISGSVNIVNPGDGDLTSVVLVPESTFQQLTETFVRGEVAPGLRAPPPPAAPDVSNQFTITGVPKGTYVVLAAFENDFLVRDPDPNIAGTQIVHVTLPEQGTGIMDVDVVSSFKITGALTMIGPGAEGPEAVDDVSTLVFSWVDDSSEDYYAIDLYDAFGDLIWFDDNVPRVSGAATVEVPYPTTAPALLPGMYYQWRATSHRTAGPISTTEDLLGVFYLPGSVN